MEKVDEKWLKKNGWRCTVDETAEQYKTYYSRAVTHTVSYNKGIGKAFAIWTHTYTRYYRTDNRGKEYLDGTSNFYGVYASGNGFKIENKVSYRKFTSDKVEAALKVCGVDE